MNMIQKEANGCKISITILIIESPINFTSMNFWNNIVKVIVNIMEVPNAKIPEIHRISEGYFLLLIAPTP